MENPNSKLLMHPQLEPSENELGKLMQDNQTEMIITNMWSKMKTLENKYIDLANFYKQELVQSQQASPAQRQSNEAQSNKSAVGGAVPPQHVAQPNATSFNQSTNQLINEDTFINELKSEKIKFEQNIQSMISGGAINMNQSQDSNSVVLNTDLHRFNIELEGVLNTIVECINSSQSQAINDLSQRQTDMFTLSSKHKLQNGFKNDSIAVWYQAKSNVTQIISKIKILTQEKFQSLLNQSIKPSHSWLEQHNFQINQNQVSHQQFSDMVLNFEEEFKNMKNQTIDYHKSVNHLQQAINATEEVISKNSRIMKSDLKTLYQTLMNYDPQQNPDTRQGSNRQSNDEQPMSPFDKRLGSYTKGALSRSNSRGPVSPLGMSTSTFKPPKLTMHQRQGEKQGKKSSHNANSLVSPIRVDKNAPIEIGVIDNHAVISKLKAFENSVQRYVMDVQSKSEIITELHDRYEDQVNKNIMKFIYTHDIDLVKRFYTDSVLTPTEMALLVAKIQQQSIAVSNTGNKCQPQAASAKRSSQSPFRVRDKSPTQRRSASGLRKTTPTRSNNNSTKLNQSNTLFKDKFNTFSIPINADEGQLYAELRRTNDRYIEQQVENRRLKDQVQLLSLQVEDLRLHNNRYQQQHANFQVQISKYKKTKTSRPGGFPHLPSDGTTDEHIDMCKKVEQFFSSMKLLQRAVNKKEDISELKVDFETKQKVLQKMAKAIQVRASTQQSMQSSKLNTSTISQNSRSNSTKGFGIKQSSSSRANQISSPMTKPRTKTANKYGVSPKLKTISITNSSRMDSQPTNIIQDQNKLQLEKDLYDAKNKIRALQDNNQQQAMDAKMIQMLKDKLLERINLYEVNLNNQVIKIKQRLQKREAELDQVKKLFVEKLKELESNFAEIGDHLIANQISQAQALQEKDNKQNKSQSILQEVLKDVNISKNDEDQSLDELVQENSKLHDKINEFKQQFKDMVSAKHDEAKQKHTEFTDHNTELQESLTNLKSQVSSLTKERDCAIQDQQSAKKEKNMMMVTLNQFKDQIQQGKLDKEKQDMTISQSIQEIQLNLKDEVEQKMVFQKEAKDNSQLIKILEEENQHMQNQLEELSLEAQELSVKNEEYKKQIKKIDSELTKSKTKIKQLTAIVQGCEEKESQNNDQLNQLTEEHDLAKAKLNQNKEELNFKDQCTVSLEEKRMEVTLKLEEKEAMLTQLQQQMKQMGVMLEEQVKVAEQNTAHEDSSKEIQQLKNQLTQLNDAQASAAYQIDELQQIKTEMEGEVEQNKHQMSEMQEKLDNAKEQYKSQLDHEIEQTKSELAKAFDKKQSETKKQNFWMTAITLKIKSMIQQKLKEEQAKNQENQLKLKEQMYQLDQIQSQVNFKDTEIVKSQELICNLNQQHNEELTKMIQAKQELENDLNHKHQGLESEKTTLQSELDQLRKNMAENQMSAQEQKQSVLIKKQEVEKLKEQMDNLKLQSDQAHQEADKHMHEQLELTKGEAETLKSQLEAKTTKLNDLKFKNEGLTLNINKMEADKVQFTKKIASHMPELEKLHDHTKSLESEHKQSIQDYEKQIEELTQSVEKLKVQAEALEITVDLHTQKIKGLEKDKQDLEEANDELKHSKDTLEKQAKKLEIEIKERQDDQDCSLKETSDKLKQIEELKTQIDHLECEKTKQDQEHQKIVAALAGEKEQLQNQIKTVEEQLQKEEQAMTVSKNDVQALTSDKTKLQETIQTLNIDLVENKSKFSSFQDEIQKLQESETELKEKLEKVHSDMSSKVEEGHDNIKKNYDIHQMNEDLSQQLAQKTEQNKTQQDKFESLDSEKAKIQKELSDIQDEFTSQKAAYKALLLQLGSFDLTKTDLESEIEKLKKEKANISTKLDMMESQKMNASRSSMNSDEDYSSVTEMKDHLKHARQILIQFICKLQYSSPENEATLPIIYSMFEFTKEEQDSITDNRKGFNQDKINDKLKKEVQKKMFGKLFTKKSDSARNSSKAGESFNSGRMNNSKI